MIFGGCVNTKILRLLLKKALLNISVWRQNVPYNFLVKARLLHVLKLSTGPMRVANTFG